jgi:NADH dehydrogenase/NADH:ubiquinone oxidoreductase subunit G
MTGFVKIQVDGVFGIVKSSISVLEAINFFGIQVPRFCYYKGLSISGNCRMCLVELKAAEKLILSCSTIVEPDMNIITNSLDVKKARENVLELLLINHPLDCPICDQGGECDLQENTLSFGSFSNKTFKVRRGVEDSNLNFLIKTVMTRCIHCTRCVRFADEIATQPTLGTLNRGENTEIGSYLFKNFNSEISGNVIDLCPVGALTNKRESFKARPWEFKSVETTDLTDSLSPSIYVNAKETKIFRILPKTDINLQSNLISNRGRFSYDALKTNRIYDNFYTLGDSVVIKKWADVKSFFLSNIILSKNIVLLVTNKADLLLINKLNQFNFFQKNIKTLTLVAYTAYNNFYFYGNNQFAIKKYKNIFLIALNLSSEAPVLNSRINLNNSFVSCNSYELGNKNLSSNPNQIFNLNLIEFLNLYEGKKKFLTTINNLENTYCLIGESAQKRFSNTESLKYCFNKENIFFIKNTLNTEAFDMLGIKSLSFKEIKNNTSIVSIDNVDSIFFRKVLKSLIGLKITLSSHFNTLKEKKVLNLSIASKYFEETGVYISLSKALKVSQKVVDSSSSSKTSLYFVSTITPILKKTFNYFFFIQENINKNLVFNNTFKFINLNKSLNALSFTLSFKYFIKINKSNKDLFQKNSYNLNVFLLRLYSFKI